MKFYLYNSVPFFLFLLLPHGKEPATAQSPLAVYSPEWNNAKYLTCNTAAKAAWFTEDEKKMIYILNLVRMDPALFASTVLKQYPDQSNHLSLRNTDEYKSLMDTLRKLKPLSLLSPDSLCFVSARCHAISSGEAGYVGHVRKTTECAANMKFSAECCEYGHKDPLAIIMALLVDEGVASLGHRYACLGLYSKVGVSIQPHQVYYFNSVLDFSF